MDEIDIAIIGAGVIGLAISKEVTTKENSVVILEKNKSFGQETSSRNSEVIHGGMNYPYGSLKSKMCVEGKRLLYEICKRDKIPHKKTSKLIVAASKEEISILDKLLIQGENNGVENLTIIDKQKMQQIEPNVLGCAALYSPDTGIIDSHQLMQYFLNCAKDNGAIFSYNSQVTGIEKLADGYKISIKNNNETETLKTQVVINCAGLDSDTTAAMVGIDIKNAKYKLHYCKGEYFRVKSSKAALIKRVIYPAPDAKGAGLGIHATLDLNGGLRLGPDDEYLKTREKNYSVDEHKRYNFYASIKKIMPFIEENDLSPDIAGIRPKLQAPGEDFRDFVIKEEKDMGFPGFINLIGIESPGLTASPAIARHVKDLIKSYVNV